MTMRKYDVAVIGGGPAGLAAAIEAKKNGANTVLIEREARLGGILKQCIHDGFGLVRFGEKLSGPEYAERFIDEFMELDIDYMLLTFVTRTERDRDGFRITAVNTQGVTEFSARTLILATGCRERTAKQVSIHGTRPAGIFTAGTAQSLTNIYGKKTAEKCVILGSGDIGLIMARRLTLEGTEVLGVFEAKPTPSGLTRNIYQCLVDYNIPLHLSHTVTRVYGKERLEGVEISKVDEKMNPIDGTQYRIDCDALILSVGLIPENEIAEKLGVTSDRGTKGPVCDQNLMTDVYGIFSCGNALHVNDLVDYVSESGEIAGKAAALCSGKERKNIPVKTGKNILYAVPQMLDINSDLSAVTLYFRSASVLDGAVLEIKVDGKEFLKKKYAFLRPPEMEKLVCDFSGCGLSGESKVEISVKEAE